MALFDVDREVSIPTWYSQLLLATGGVLALFIRRVHRTRAVRDAGYWLAIGLILIYMSLDEGASVHEIATGPMRSLMGTEGTILHQSWTVLGVAAVIVVALVFVRFWWRLPSRPRLFVAVAAATYVVGAVGFEVIGGYVSANVSVGMKYSAVVVFEESFEMLGAVLALYAFMDYLRGISSTTVLELAARRTPQTA